MDHPSKMRNLGYEYIAYDIKYLKKQYKLLRTHKTLCKIIRILKFKKHLLGNKQSSHYKMHM